MNTAKKMLRLLCREGMAVRLALFGGESVQDMIRFLQEK